MRLARSLVVLGPFLLLAGCGGGQDRAVQEIKSLEGKYTQDENAPGKPVVVVDLGFRSAGDATLEQIKDLPQLRELYLWNTGVTDNGLPHLAGLTQLQKLDLSGTAVSDAGLKHLKGLSGLKEINLKSTRVTAAGIKDFQRAVPQAKVIR